MPTPFSVLPLIWLVATPPAEVFPADLESTLLVQGQPLPVVVPVLGAACF